MSNMNKPTTAWIEMARAFRTIKASQSGFGGTNARDDFIARRFAHLCKTVAHCQPRPEVFREVLNLGSVDLFEASIKAHGTGKWKSQTPKPGLAYPAGSGNLDLLKRMEAYQFDLSSCVGKILITAAQKDDADLLDWWFHMGFGELPEIKVSLRKVIEPCGPNCAPRIHDLIVSRLDSCAPFAGGAVFIEAIRDGRLKVAAYLRSAGVRFDNISDVWEALAPDAGIFSHTIEKRLRSLEGSAHAQMSFLALEPDALSVLGRPKHDTFIGLSKDALMESAFDAALCD